MVSPTVINTVAFTGHRPQRLCNLESLAIKLRDVLKELSTIAPIKCISGMALGFDTLAAQVCVDLGIPFIAAIPFEDQDSRWGTQDKELYRYLLSESIHVEVVCPGEYANWKYFKRDHWMVDNADMVIAAWDGLKAGGTWATIKYANKQKKHVVNIFGA